MSAERDERMHRWRKVNRKARIKIGTIETSVPGTELT